MRCDPVMMADLGGPQDREWIPEKVRRDIRLVEEEGAWIKMIVPDESRPELVAGSVTLWSHEEDGARISETGWMVLPEFQGRGIARQAERMLLELAREEADRWGLVHAYPAVTNGPSNGVCRSLGFRPVGEQEIDVRGAMTRCNHWVIDPSVDLA
jgi:RimJ/RimL family protein N-acetyltransferase